MEKQHLQMNSQESSISVLVFVINLTICLLQKQMLLPLFKKNVLFQVYSSFERLNDMYVFEFHKEEVCFLSVLFISLRYVL